MVFWWPFLLLVSLPGRVACCPVVCCGLSWCPAPLWGVAWRCVSAWYGVVVPCCLFPFVGGVCVFSALFWGAVLRCLAVLPAVCCLLLPLLCCVAPSVRRYAVLCWRACIASLSCDLLLSLCWSVSCGVVCGFWLFLVWSCHLVLFSGGALRRPRPWCCPVVCGSVSWCPAALCCVLWCCAAFRCRVAGLCWCLGVPCCLFCLAFGVCLFPIPFKPFRNL